MKFVIAKINKNQYFLEEGKTLEIDKIEANAGDKIEISEVLLKTDDKAIEVGKPYLKDASVTIEVLMQKKGDKVTTTTYKAKARQRKIKGQRPHITVIKVTKIS